MMTKISLSELETALHMEKRLIKIRNSTDDEIKEMWGGKFSRSQTAEKIRADAFNPDIRMIGINYRPFDQRWTYFTGKTDGLIVSPRRDTFASSGWTDGGYYFNRINPTDRFSKTIDFEAFDSYLMPYQHLTGIDYALMHPFARPIWHSLIDETMERRECSFKGALGFIADNYHDIRMEFGTHPDQRSDEPHLAMPISMYNLGNYPYDPERVAEIVREVESGEFQRKIDKSSRRATGAQSTATRLMKSPKPKRLPPHEPHLNPDGTPCECEMCAAKNAVFSMLGIDMYSRGEADAEGDQMRLL